MAKIVTVGYRNLTGAPMALSLRGQVYRLEAGQWLVDQNGKKLTDPDFMGMVGPGKLAVIRVPEGAPIPDDAPKAPSAVQAKPASEDETKAVPPPAAKAQFFQEPLPPGRVKIAPPKVKAATV